GQAAAVFSRLSLHDALPIWRGRLRPGRRPVYGRARTDQRTVSVDRCLAPRGGPDLQPSHTEAIAAPPRGSIAGGYGRFRRPQVPDTAFCVSGACSWPRTP